MGSWLPRMVLPAVSLEQVRRIAAGEAVPDAAGLAPRMLKAAGQFRPDLRLTWSMEVAFCPPSNDRMESWGFGWPTDWIWRQRSPVYQDAVRKIGLQRAATNPSARPLGPYEFPSNLLAIPPMSRFEWRGLDVTYRPPPESTGGVYTTTNFRFTALAAPAAILIVCWHAFGAAVWWLERRGGKASKTRRARLVAAASLMALILALAMWRGRATSDIIHLSPDLTPVGSPGPVYWKRAGYSRLKLNRSEVEALAEAPDGDRRLAAAILDAATIPAGSPDSLYLAAVSDPEVVLDGSRSETTSVARLLPVISVNREYYMRRPDFGTPEAVAHPPGMRMWSGFGSWSFVWPSADTDRPTVLVTIWPESIGMLILGLWIVGWLAWFLVGQAVRIQIRRRHARGLCPQCGYVVVIGTP